MKSSPIEKVFQKSPSWKKVKSILTTCRKAGFVSVVAGGAVRDALLGKIPKDFDIAVSAQPNQILRLFRYGREVGKSFGVVLIGRDPGIEVASFRKDGPYLDGRRPSFVEFCGIKEDSKRRDFTINSLYYDAIKKEVLDFTGGIQDLKRKIIRTVGSPDRRFSEDRLRTLRAVRFAVDFGFEIHPQTFKALKKWAKKIQQISKERITEEIKKMFWSIYCKNNAKLSEKAFIKMMMLFKDTGLFSILWPKWQLPHERYQKLWSLPATLRSDHKDQYLLVCWSFLFAPAWIRLKDQVKEKKQKSSASARIFEQSTSFMQLLKATLKDLKLSGDLIQKVLKFYSFYFTIIDSKIRQGQKLQLMDQPEGLLYFYMSRQLEKASPTPVSFRWNSFYRLYQEKVLKNGHLPRPFVKGEDLLKAGVPAGPKISHWIRFLYSEQLEGLITSKKQALMRLKQLELL